MNIVCPFCNRTYRVSDERFPAGRVLSARCKQCGGRITVDPAASRRLAPASSSPRPEKNLDGPAEFSLAEVRDVPEPAAETIRSNLDCLRFGWQAVKREPLLTIVGMVIVPFAIQAAAEVLQDSLPPEAGGAKIVLALVTAFFEMAVTLGIAVIGLKLTDGKAASFKDLHAHYRRVPAYIAASLMTGLLCLLGFALLVLPGILFSVWFSFYALPIVDAGAGPLRAMGQSFRLARGNFWRITGFWGWVFLLNLLGLIPCGMGLLLTLPVTFIAWACRYRTLQAQSPLQNSSISSQTV